MPAARRSMARLAAAAVVLLAGALAVAAAPCVPAATSDSVPSNPTLASMPDADRLVWQYSSAANASHAFVRLGCSERVTVFSQTQPYTGEFASDLPLPSTSTWPRDNCPHLAAGLTPLSTAVPSLLQAASGADIVIPTNARVLLRACDLPDASQTDESFVFRRITVSTGAELVLDDAPLTLRVRELVVQAGASLLAGSETCRLFSKQTVVFHGTKADAEGANPTQKGLIVNGRIDVHGKLYYPTWTRLAKSIAVNDTILYLQETVNWEIGQEVLVTTTILLDCPDEYAGTWCKPNDPWNAPVVKHQNEVRTIRALVHSPVLPSTSTKRFSALVLDRPLSFVHYAGMEYQAEVSLLSRRIEFRGDSGSAGEKFGGHVMVSGPNAEGRFSGVRGFNMGQLNQLGRYPFHFHLMSAGENARRSYFQDCSVVDSFFRCYVVHGTNGTRISRNTAFNVWGMCFYLEDGVEEHNLFEYNLAAHIHPIFKPANGGYGQGGETFLAQPGLLIPADTSAAGFYALNANNAFIGNAVSGGWCGFAFPNAPRPIGDFKDALPASSNWAPQKRPLKKFIGNSAHSNGYHWVEHGSSIYVGAKLDYDNNGVLRYNSGRNNRDSVNADGSSHIMVFEHSKVFLTNKGIAHWGNTVRIHRAEFHDCRYAAMLFGEASLVDALVVKQTPNLKSNYVVNRAGTGFQFYDTWVKSILAGVTFRNFTRDSAAIRYLDHSDHYTPQGINTVRSIRYENTSPYNALGIDHCGAACGDQRSSMAARIYSVWDSDGSMSGSGVPTILGSFEPWWDHSPELACQFRTERKVWTCPWHERTTVGFIGPAVEGTLYNGCDYGKFGSGDNLCNDQTAPYFVGTMSQWGGDAGKAKSVAMPPWRGVAGLVNTGWYWRVRAPEYSIDGAPSKFVIDETMQLPRSTFVVLAVAYPAGTTFTVKITSRWYNIDQQGTKASWTIPQASTLATVLTAREDLVPASQFTCPNNWWEMCNYASTGGVGPTWYFDGTHFYLRVVNPTCYNRNSRGNCENAYYTEAGVRVPDITSGFVYSIEASCPSCTVGTTFENVQYWTTPDVAPAARFPADFGPLRAPPPADPAFFAPLGTCARFTPQTGGGGGFGTGAGGDDGGDGGDDGLQGDSTGAGRGNGETGDDGAAAQAAHSLLLAMLLAATAVAMAHAQA